MGDPYIDLGAESEAWLPGVSIRGKRFYSVVR